MMFLSLEIGPVTKEVEFEELATLLDILRKEGISPDISIVFSEGKPIPLDSEAREGMTLRVVSVASGG